MITHHYLLTRFNVATGYAAPQLGITDDWLAHRITLFEQFCVPSIQHQSTQAFHWLLLIAPQTPAHWRHQLTRILQPFGDRAVLIESPVFSETPFIHHMQHHTHERPGTHILTTRLDNDDALAAGHLQLVREAAERESQPGEPLVLHAPRGAQWHEGRVYYRDYPFNAFLSYSAPRDQLRTAFRTDHTRMGVTARTHTLHTTDPQWLMVVHDRNVSNQLRSHHLAQPQDLHGFPWLPATPAATPNASLPPEESLPASRPTR